MFQVKGSFFVAARVWLDEHHAEALPRILERIPPEHREPLSDPLPSEFYPEESFQHALRAVDEELTHGDPVAFADVMDACTEIGLGKFFRALVRLSTPGFVLKQVPTIWAQMRKGGGKIDVTEPSHGVFELHYQRFPYFSDPRYGPMTVGNLRALVRGALGKNPKAVEIAHQTHDALIIRITI